MPIDPTSTGSVSQKDIALAAAGGSGGGSGSGTPYASADLSQAQVLAMPGTPVLIVPAPASGQMLIPVAMVAVWRGTSGSTSPGSVFRGFGYVGTVNEWLDTIGTQTFGNQRTVTSANFGQNVNSFPSNANGSGLWFKLSATPTGVLGTLTISISYIQVAY